MCKARTTSAIYSRQQRVFRSVMERGRRQARTAHPETGGMELYVHNWGNEQAKRAWACAWALWRVLEPKLNALYHAAEHADHVALDRPAFWCDECNHKSVARS